MLKSENKKKTTPIVTTLFESLDGIEIIGGKCLTLKCMCDF